MPKKKKPPPKKKKPPDVAADSVAVQTQAEVPIPSGEVPAAVVTAEIDPEQASKDQWTKRSEGCLRDLNKVLDEHKCKLKWQPDGKFAIIPLPLDSNTESPQH